MSMNGIDISGWNDGINISAVPSDFVIVKATQGTAFVSRSFHTQINAAAKAGKLLGVYHYIDGTSGAAAEMRHFYNTIKDWVGKVIICLDWESYSNSQFNNPAYLGECIKEIKRLTGKTIVLYTGMYYYGALEQGDKYGCKRWIAKYASNDPVYGYQETPWAESTTPCWIRQYSGAGRLQGYNGNLDLNKAYCTRDEWLEVAGAEIEKPVERVYDVKPIYNNGGDIYRYYNEKNGQHHYCDANECKSLIYPWKSEGVAFTAPKGGTKAVYRMYNPNDGRHMFTADFNEASKLEKDGWIFENVPFFGKDSGTPVYRLYNPNSFDHLLTKDANEKAELIKAGWKDEGVAFYV